ncbi:phage tail spike protein [Staphylococcus sp. LKG3-3]|uniref:phage tail spike protein n=1 Tax=Staphylococcus sp. LKG3-3 TaxID=3399685 RepID=UPI003D42B1A3
MIHVLDFDDNIIDYISKYDNYITQGSISRDTVEETDTFDFIVDSDRAYNLRERNRIVVQDRNNVYREYIIVNVSDDIDDQTTVQCNASYVEDLTTAKPYTPGGFTKFTTTQALDDITKDTGWETSEETEYGGVRSSSWTSYQTRYEVARQMRTTYGMVLDFSIELSSNSVAHRYVSLKNKQSLFKGKEIVYGKDLLSMTRTVDITGVHTALLAIGPEDESGKRREVIVTDDDAQAQFGLDKRYIWGVYEPESDDTEMTEARLKTLATTQLNKDKQAAISYEITSADLSKQYSHEQVDLGDTVRVKDTEFNPPLYIDAEVVSEVYDIISGESTFTFGNVKEYKESELRKDLYDRLDDIRKKMNDNISNVNTIVEDVVAGQLEYFERKIIKSATPPENPVNDMMWYDTSNPEVAVLRRYWNGEWVEETANNVEKIGGITREKALFSELTNTFVNLTIQHSKLQSDVYEVVSNEYLIDDDLRAKVNAAYNNTTATYDNIKSNLDSMTPETATIGKLVDTQALFLTYRERMQALYKAIENAKRAIDKRFKLLQSQYTDEKFNTAMEQIAATLPNGQWDSENMQLLGDIPSREELAQMQNTVIQFMAREVSSLSEAIGEETNNKIKVAKDELSASINSVKREIDGIDTSIQDAQNEAVAAAKAYADAQDKLKETELQAYADGVVDEVEQRAIEDATNKLNEAKTYAEQKALDAKNAAITESERLAQESEIAAKNYADAQDELQQVEAQAYADGIVDAEEQRAIQDATDKLNAAKTYAETKATEAKNAAITDAANKLKPITTRVTTAESGIKILQDGLKLTATKTDVQQTLDEQLQPIKNQVDTQKATLDVLPAQIAGKVSQSTYDTDKNNIVSRLNSADTERVQLSNSIADRVTLKQYTDGKAATTNEINNAVNNVQVGTRNLLEDSINLVKPIEMTSSPTLNQYWFANITTAHNKLNIGDEITISFDVQMERGDYLKIYDSNQHFDYRFGEEVFKNIGNTKKRLSFTKILYAPIKTGNIWNLAFYNNNNGDRFTIEKIKIEKGNKATDWTPAPEDIDNKINANKADTEQRLTTMQTSIIQNGTEINQRATREEFNASKKTLSNIISDLTINTTTGITMSYDENGAISSHTVDKNGVKIRGDKVDIAVNKEFQVLAGNVDDKVGKGEIINRLNLSPEGLDINVNNIGIRGGDSKKFLSITNNEIRQRGQYQRVWLGENLTYDVTTTLKEGYLRFGDETRKRALNISAFGISTFLDGNGDTAGSAGSSGTIAWWDPSYSPSGANGITINSYGGVAALTSGLNRTMVQSRASVNLESMRSAIYLRPQKSQVGNSTFAFTTTTGATSNADVKGYLMFGDLTDEDNWKYYSGLRFYKGKSYIEVVDGDFTAGGNTVLDAGNVLTNSIFKRNGSTTVYWNGTSGGTIDDGALPLDNQLVATSMVTNRGDKNMYLGTRSGGSLLVTDERGYNSGKGQSYSGVGAARFTNMSLESLKTDIEAWNYDALNVLVNETQIYQYKLKNDVENGGGFNNRGLIIGDGYETPTEFRSGDGVNLYEMSSWQIRAIQQLNEKLEEQNEIIKKLEEQLNGTK